MFFGIFKMPPISNFFIRWLGQKATGDESVASKSRGCQYMLKEMSRTAPSN